MKTQINFNSDQSRRRIGYILMSLSASGKTRYELALLLDLSTSILAHYLAHLQFRKVIHVSKFIEGPTEPIGFRAIYALGPGTGDKATRPRPYCIKHRRFMTDGMETIETGPFVPFRNAIDMLLFGAVVHGSLPCPKPQLPKQLKEHSVWNAGAKLRMR